MPEKDRHAPVTDAAPNPFTPRHRSPDAVAADLADARSELLALETKVRDHNQKRGRALARRERLEADWRKQNPDEPFDPDAFNPPAHVPPADHPEQRKFHALHYKVGRFEAELEASKKAEVSVL